MKRLTLIILAFLLFSISINAQFKRKKAKAEKIEATCQGLLLSERPRITVSRFDVTAYRAQKEFGKELSTMLSNALVETGCFNVLSGDINDLTGEMKINQQMGGEVTEGGKVRSAQYFVTGQITEFEENHRGATVAGVKVGAYKAHIGFIIQIKNAHREIIFSKSIDRTRTRPGTGGITLFKFPIATASFKSKAMAEALERGIIDAVEILVKEKDKLEMNAPKELAEQTVFDKTNCPVLASSNIPKVMVVIPEIHIQRKVPDPAGETAIIKQLINAGFPVVDPSMYSAIRNGGNINHIVKNPVEAANLGAQHGADIVIIGEAFSEFSGQVNGMSSCRARIEARAISTKDATIIATDGKHASGLDISELVSSKAALRNAGDELGNYFLQKLCSSSNEMLVAKGSTGTSIEIIIKNADFAMLSNVSNYLKSKTGVSNLTKKLVDQKGIIMFNSVISIDEIANEVISNTSAKEKRIKEFSEFKIVIE